MNHVEKEILKSIILIKSGDNNTLYAECCFLPDFIGFKGHFENKPILPGICLLETVKTVLQKHLKCLCTIGEIKTAKFFTPIEPSEKIFITITNNKPFTECDKDNEIVLTAEVKKDDTKVAFFKLQFKDFKWDECNI
jgi:3-hydroxyacyl-[acyl-carrier-protein] dehydratase